ncbi:hypothetical protein PVAND_015299 [Polypedilum vanderplanki]|uniref:Uncharacterized protein n=1 Tax=Polypedilum vanderplanki TaxID=319348 RepID=A0A9J6BC86_POLVA|nr:hypothetical protein PVAND_015299 [Polypedilum vanderplanki]
MKVVNRYAKKLRQSQRIKSYQSKFNSSTSTDQSTTSSTRSRKFSKKSKKQKSFELKVANFKRTRQILENQLGGIMRSRAEDHFHYNRVMSCFRDQRQLLNCRINSYQRQCMIYHQLTNDMHNIILLLKNRIIQELGEEFLYENPEDAWKNNEE